MKFRNQALSLSTLLLNLHFRLAIAVIGDSRRDCVRLPAVTAHATFSVRGWFQARLGCPRADQDIALNAQGDQGTLLCDPHSPFNFEVRDVRLPDCHPLKIPQKVRMTITLVYDVASCERTSPLVNDVFNLLDKYILAGDEPCGLGMSVCKRTLDNNTCTINRMESRTKWPFQVKIHYSLSTLFNPGHGLGFYRRAAESVKQRLGYTADRKLSQAGRAALHVPNGKLAWAQVYSWRGTCVEHRNSVGTDLEMDGVLTCRGCPRKTALYAGDCLPCVFGSFTNEPFASYCRACYDVHWEDTKVMNELCFQRP